MFTEEDLETLVPRKIFERGLAYYGENDAVGRITRKGNTFKAKVEGTETYRVELTVHAGEPPEIHCDCPYEHGDVCKHGIALGLAVLDLLGDEAVEAAAPLPPTKLSKADQSVRILKAAWARTSDKEKLAFLQQLLARKPKLLRKFLAAFEFDEGALLALGTSSKPKPKPAPKPVPRRPLTLTEQAHRLLDAKRGHDLLPLLLTVDWLQNPPAWDTHTLPYLLSEAARAQPEATLDAAMERFETYLENKALRTWPLYNRLAACLKALAQLPALAKQVQLFASELMRQYRQLRALHKSLGHAGFAVMTPEEATDGPLKRRKPRPKPEASDLPPKRRGRQPKKAVG